jgi:cell division protein FtsL
MSKKMMRKDTREQKIIYSAFLVSLAIVIVSIITVMTYSLYKTSKNSNVLEEKSKEITKIADALEQYKKDN